MRRLALMAAAVGVLAIPAAASAYPVPGGISSSPSTCGPRPADDTATQPAGGVLSIESTGQNAAANATVTVNSGGPVPGGFAQLGVADGGAGNFRAVVNVQDAAGAWHQIGAFVVVAPQNLTQLIYLPPGPVQIVVVNMATFSEGYTIALSAGYEAAGDVDLGQRLSDLCNDQSAWSSTAHSDATAIKSAVSALAPQGTTLGDIKNAVSALSNGAKLDTLDGDLGQLHSDNLAIEAELNGGAPPSGGGGTATDVSLTGPVQLSSADRQIEADVASQTDGDLWIIVGAMVGCFATGFILNRLFPS